MAQVSIEVTRYNCRLFAFAPGLQPVRDHLELLAHNFATLSVVFVGLRAPSTPIDQVNGQHPNCTVSQAHANRNAGIDSARRIYAPACTCKSC
jgi:hypothetical protein